MTRRNTWAIVAMLLGAVSHAGGAMGWGPAQLPSDSEIELVKPGAGNEGDEDDLPPPASQPADTPGPASRPAMEITDEMVKKTASMMHTSEPSARMFLRQIQTNPAIMHEVVKAYPEFGNIVRPSPPPAAPGSTPTAELRARQKQRDQADALVAQIAQAAPEKLAEIETEMAKLGPVSMVPLKLAEASGNFELRQRALRIAGRLRWRLACPEALLKAQPTLVDVMSGTDAPARAAMVEKAAAIGFLRECLADPQVGIRQQAVDVLVGLYRGNDDDNDSGAPRPAGVKSQVLGLLETALSDPDRNTRLLAIGGMAKLGAVSLRKMSELLGDESTEVRAMAIKAMGFSRDKDAANLLLPLLNDPQWRIRVAALESLEKIGESDKQGAAAEKVAALLDDPDTYVRGMAAKLVGNWGFAKAADKLLRMAKEGALSEDAAFTALGELDHAPGAEELKSRYAAATDPARRTEVLALLTHYRKSAAADPYFRQAMGDPTMRAQWARIIPMMGRQSKSEALVPTIWGLLETTDAALAEASEAAWKMVEQHATEVQLPADLAARVMASESGPRALQAFLAEYRYNDPGFAAIHRAALRSKRADMLTLALGMVGFEQFTDTMGTAVPDYRRNRDRGRIDDDGSPAKKKEPSPEVKEALAEALKRPEESVRLLAAAILFRSRADTSEPVQAQLRAGLVQKDLALRQTAMAGIVENPKPFLDAYDVTADAKNPDTRHRAIEIMGNARDPKYTPTLIAMLPDTSYYEDQNLYRALVSTGDEKAIAAVMASFEGQKGPEYPIRQLGEELTGMPGPGPVKYLAWAIKKSKSYDAGSLMKVLASLPDPSAPPLLATLLKDKKIAESGDSASIVVALAQSHPAEGLPLLKTMLEGKGDRQDAAIYALVQSKPSPSPEIVAMLLTMARNQGKNKLNWGMLGAWLPVEVLRDQFLPVLGELNPSLQYVIVDRVAEVASPKDLSGLLKLSSAGMGSQEGLAALTGLLTATRPDVRPAMGGLGEQELVNVLNAAGDWADAPAVVGPYLKDPRDRVSAAACRGLALFLVGNPAAPASDVHREALLAALRRKDPLTAYWAAEAVGQRWPDELTRVDPAQIPTVTASLRIAAEYQGPLPEALRTKVANTLASPTSGSTPRELALCSAIRSPSQAYSIAFDRVGTAHLDLVIRALMASGKSDQVLELASSRVYVECLPGGKEFVSQRLAQAQPNTSLWKSLVLRGWIGPNGQPQPGDLLRFINVCTDSDRVAVVGLFRSSKSERDYWDPSQGMSELEVAMRWAPPTPDEQVLARIGTDSMAGVLAAAVAAVQWNSPQGRKTILEVATDKKYAKTGRQAFARSVLPLCAKAQDSPLLVEAVMGVPKDDYGQEQASVPIWQALVQVAPAEALKAMGDLAAKDGDHTALGAQAFYAAAAIATVTHDGVTNKPETGLARYGLSSIQAALFSARQRATTPTTAPAPDGMDVWNRLTLIPPLDIPSSWHPTRWLLESPAKSMDDYLKRVVQTAKASADLKDTQGGAVPPFLSRGGRMTGDSPEEQPVLSPDFLAGTPEEHYRRDRRNELLPIRLYLDGAAIDKALRPLVEDTDPQVRLAGMRLGAYWQVESLADAVAKNLSSDASCVEAAWALLALRWREAAPSIEEAWKAQKDFDLRVRLACVLRLAGSQAARADIERALALRTIRQVRLRVIEVQPDAASRRAMMYHDEGPVAQFMGGGLRRRLLPWDPALSLAAQDRLEEAERRFPPGRPASEPASQTQPTTAASRPVAPVETIDLSNLYLTDQGVLSASVPGEADLPITPLMYAGPTELYRTAAPGFARLCAAEQGLESRFFVQFADQAVDLQDLKARWSTWWSANRQAGAEAWWKQAIGQAVEELTHAAWWHRMRAARRLSRLTGQAVVPPDAFDLGSWKALQARWRQSLAAAPGSPREALLKAGLDAGILQPGAMAHAGDEKAWVGDLVRLAGFAPEPLAEAALLQLKTRPNELSAQAVEPWRHCPRPDLARWVFPQPSGNDLPGTVSESAPEQEGP